MSNPYNLEDDFFTSTAQNGMASAATIISDENALILEELTPKINRFFYHRQLQDNLKINGTVTCDNIIAKNLSTVDETTGNITTNLTVNNDLSIFEAEEVNVKSLSVVNPINGNLNGNARTVTNGIYTTSNVTDLSDVADAGSGKIITREERVAIATNASGIATNAEAINSINATKLYLNTTPSVPNEQDSQGVKGEIRMDTEYIYICVANSTWKRVALDNSDGW